MRRSGLLETGLSCPANSYWGAGFTTLQYLVDDTLMTIRNSSFEIPKLKIRQLPKKAYNDHGYSQSTMTVFRSIVPLYITLSMSMFITPMLTVVVDEKEKKIKETLKMVGLRDSVFWLSWFFVYAFLILISSLCGSLLISLLVFSSSSYFLITFILMLQFGLTIIMFAFMLTALFSKAKIAATVGGMSTMAFTMLYYIQVRNQTLPISMSMSISISMSITRNIKFNINEGVCGRRRCLCLLADGSL